MKWFRFWNDSINDVKLLQLSDYEFRMWTYLLSYASETDSTSGQLQTTFKLLSLHFHQRFNLFSRAIETFQKVGLIAVDSDGYITIINWNKRQFKSDNTYERVKKHREVTQKRNVSVTAPETDTETDTDKPPISPKGDVAPAYSKSFSDFWQAYPKKTGKDAAWRAWKKRKDIPATEILLKIIGQQKTSDQWKRGFIPNPATWINQGRWMDDASALTSGISSSVKQYRQPTQDAPPLPEYEPEDIPDIDDETRAKRLAEIADFSRKFGRAGP